MEGLVEGRIVHYVMHDGEHRPAIVVKVWRVQDYEDGEVVGLPHPPVNGCCNFVVFVDGYNDVKRSIEDPSRDVVTSIWETSVLYSELKESHTWHWIERS